jgi:hypothetical protein
VSGPDRLRVGDQSAEEENHALALAFEACPSPKPRPPQLGELTGRKKLRTRRGAKVVSILWPSTLPSGTRFSGGGGRPGGQREEEKLPVCMRWWR